MKTQFIEYSHDADLPEAVRSRIPEEVHSIFRGFLNSHLRDGSSEMNAYAKAYRSLSILGYERDEIGKWVKKSGPTVNSVHSPRPLGSDEETEKKDVISVDVPLLIRLLELAREELKEDVPIHLLAERLTALSETRSDLDMSDYDSIVSVLKETRKFDPPVEVVEAAKRALGEIAKGVEFASVDLRLTEALAKGEGLGKEVILKIDEHFKSPSADSDLDAWGGKRAGAWAARVVEKYSPSQPRNKDGEFSSGGGKGSASEKEPLSFQASAKMQRALESRVPCGVEKQRAADVQEGIISRALGIKRTKNNSAFDLQNDKVGVEIKTMIDSKNGKITMSREAMNRKMAEAKKNNISMHTVVADKRGGKTTYYHAPGVGSFRVSSMTQVSLGELKGVIRGR